MSTAALNFVGGIPFQLLYDGIKIAIHRSSKFRSNLINLQFTLDSLQSRIIEEIGENNVELNLPNNIIEGIETKMNEGVALVAMLSELRAWNIRIWGNCYNCIGPNFAEQLDELDRSLRSLLDQLELEQRRNVTRLLILATNARDEQDDLEKRQLDILKGQQEILGMLMEQHHAIGRIVSSSVQQAASSTGGGGTAPALGLVFQLLFYAVTQVKVKNEMVKRLLRRFKSTLNCLEPLIQEVAKSKRVLHLPEQEIEMFISEVENGVELIHKCSKVSKRMNYKKSKYTNKILHLDMSLQRLFFELKGQLERRLNEAMDSANSIEAVIKKIEGGADQQKNELKSESQSSVPQPGSFAIGLDILNDQGHRDMNNDTLVDSTRNVEVVEPIKTKSSFEVPPSPAGGLDVLNLQGSMDMDSATSNIKAGVTNMEGREVDDSKMNVQETKGVHLKGTLDSEINVEKIGLRGVEKIEGGGGSQDIKIAKTEPLSPAVRLDHRGELYKKHHPPMLEDEVWRLEKIGKDGAFHRKLATNNIHTVQDFLKMFFVDRMNLKKILGIGMSEKMWEVTVKHARTCLMGNKMYIFRGPHFELYLSPICQVMKAVINGQTFPARDLDYYNRNYIENLVRQAHANWNSLETVDCTVLNETALLTQGHVEDHQHYPQAMMVRPVRALDHHEVIDNGKQLQLADDEHKCIINVGAAGYIHSNVTMMGFECSDNWQISSPYSSFSPLIDAHVIKCSISSAADSSSSDGDLGSQGL